MHLIGLVVLSVVFMAAQDFFGTSMVIHEARGTRFWPGFFDACNDFASRYGGGITAAAVVTWGLWTWQTFVIVAAVACTSFFTTNETTALQHRVNKPTKENQ